MSLFLKKRYMFCAFLALHLGLANHAIAFDKVGVVNLQNRFVIPPKYRQIHYLGFGVFKCVKSSARPFTKNSVEDIDLIDADGNPTSMAALESARTKDAKRREANRLLKATVNNFSNGLAVFQEESTNPAHKQGVTYRYSGRFHEPPQVVPITIEHPLRFGYKDCEGRVVIAAKYIEARPFKDGLGVVRLNSPPAAAEYCYINVKGKQVSPIFWRAREFRDGLAVAAINDDSAIPFGDNFIGTGRHGRFGVINRNFSFVIQPKHAEIARLGKDVFVAQPVGNEVSFLINRNGRRLGDLPKRYTIATRVSDDLLELSQPIPTGSEGPDAIRVNSEGKIVSRSPDRTRNVRSDASSSIAVESSNNIQKDWDSGAHLIFTSSDGSTRKVSFNKHKDNGLFQKGLAVLIINDAHVPCFSKYHSLQGVLDIKGNWIFQPERSDFVVAESNRIIKTVYQEHFSVEDRKESGSLEGQLSFLLNDYNLIGMPKSQLVDLIGPLMEAGGFSMCRYSTIGTCGSSSISLQIEFENDRVKRWKLAGPGTSSPTSQSWNDKDVVCDYWNEERFRPKR